MRERDWNLILGSSTLQYDKPSLVCDLHELHGYLVDDFVIQFCQGLKERAREIR